MKTERLTPAERAEAALGATVLRAEEDVLAGKEGAEAAFQTAYRQWARRRSAGLSPAACVGAALGAIFGALVGELAVPASASSGVPGGSPASVPEAPAEVPPEANRPAARASATRAELRPYMDAIRAEQQPGQPVMSDFVLARRARVMHWFAERPGYHADKEARAPQAMKTDLWLSTRGYLVRHGFLKYAQGDGWTATPKLLALTAESPRSTAPALTVPTLDDVRLPVAASGRPVGRAASQARLKERLRVLICMREMRRGTVAELVAACGTRTGRTIRDLKALQRLGHVQTDFVTWEITE